MSSSALFPNAETLILEILVTIVNNTVANAASFKRFKNVNIPLSASTFANTALTSFFMYRKFMLAAIRQPSSYRTNAIVFL